METILLFYLFGVNLLAFIVYGVDKSKARKSRWRIPETVLLMLAVVGGSVGAWMGMRVWHHKTLHLKFKYGIPFIFLLQIAFCIYLWIKMG
ncbi:MAG: DUF1294 domain-containing protein [Bacteroidaceae bacterium]|nr:DUF1294 domain-containing protein [Bacteroidaceae bacterium]